ncbi:cache domain-containing protein, partial [Clostridiaceae bacterium HSG29]|nr:cache domain-containing protein [Clostridiaceae bacterium HSG29]
YSSMKNKLINEEISERNMQLENVNNYFLNNFMSEMENFVIAWAKDSRIVNYEKPDGVEKLVRKVPDNFDLVVKLWQGYEMSNTDIAWIYFASEEDGGIYIEPLDESMPLEYDCRSRDWYKDAISNRDEVVWTEPYIDAGDSGEVIITVAKAVVKDGKIKGVVGADLKLTRFSRIIGNLKFGNDGTLMLVDDKGYIFAHPNHDMLSMNLANQNWANKIYRDKEENFIIEVNGIKSMISYLNVNNVNWKLIGISPINFETELLVIRNELIQVAILASIFIVFLGSLLSIEITLPLNIIMETIGKISDGDIDARCFIKSNDEFEIMGNELNNMLDKLKETLIEKEEYAVKINENYISTVGALANAIEVSDEYTSGHCNRVSKIAKKIAIEMELSDSEIKDLEFASLLHDIGKIGIPTSIITKEGRLTKEEYNIIKTHPEIGYNILHGIEFLLEARIIILQHHERIDGTGYPNGLKGNEISVLAKILSVADAYDAMTSSRYYRKIPLTESEAIQELINCEGTQFDEAIVGYLREIVLKTKNLAC